MLWVFRTNTLINWRREWLCVLSLMACYIICEVMQKFAVKKKFKKNRQSALTEWLKYYIKLQLFSLLNTWAVWWWKKKKWRDDLIQEICRISIVANWFFFSLIYFQFNSSIIQRADILCNVQHQDNVKLLEMNKKHSWWCSDIINVIMWPFIWPKPQSDKIFSA